MVVTMVAMTDYLVAEQMAVIKAVMTAVMMAVMMVELKVSLLAE